MREHSMSDQSQEPTAEKHPVPQDFIRKDASPAGHADAALALAVTAAERAAGAARQDKAPPAGSTDQAKVEAAIPPRPAASRPVAALRWAAAAVALAALGGAAAGGYGLARHQPADPALVGAVAALHQGQGDVVRLTGDVKSLKIAVDALKDGLDRARPDAAQRQSQILDRIDRAERAPQDLAVGVSRLGEQLGRIEAAAKEPGTHLAGLTERLERIERQIAATAKPTATAAGPAAPPAPEPAAQTGSVAKDAPVEGWVLREVYDGVALIEGRNRRLVEVGPGEQVPGVGRVEAIERRGKRWVVVTAKGLIAMPR
jgi:hypothetical protein